MQVIHLAGLPFETADSEELNYRKAVRDVMLRGLSSSRFAVYHHIVRRQVDARTEGVFADAFSAEISTRPGARAWRARKLYVNDLFLTIVRRPLQGQGGADRRLPARPEGNRQGRGRRHIGRRPPRTGQRPRQPDLGPRPYGARLLTTYDGPAAAAPSRWNSCPASTTARCARCWPRKATPASTCRTAAPASAWRRWNCRAPAPWRAASGPWSRSRTTRPRPRRDAGRPAAPAVRDGRHPELRLRRPPADAGADEPGPAPHEGRRR
jgi:hypothetical protein